MFSKWSFFFCLLSWFFLAGFFSPEFCKHRVHWKYKKVPPLRNWCRKSGKTKSPESLTNCRIFRFFCRFQVSNDLRLTVKECVIRWFEFIPADLKFTIPTTTGTNGLPGLADSTAWGIQPHHSGTWCRINRFSLICYRAPQRVLPVCPLSAYFPTACKTKRVLHAK